MNPGNTMYSCRDVADTSPEFFYLLVDTVHYVGQTPVVSLSLPIVNHSILVAHGLRSRKAPVRERERFVQPECLFWIFISSTSNLTTRRCWPVAVK